MNSKILSEYDKALMQLATDVEQAARGEKNALIERFAEFWRKSFPTVARHLKEKGLRSKPRKKRSDTGKSETFTEEQVTLAMNMVNQSARQNGKQLLSAESVLENLKANGVIREGSVSTLLRQAKELNMHPTQLNQPTPFRHLRALHPNHVMSVDASICVYQKLENGGLKVMLESEAYKNKPQNYADDKSRLIRYILVDKASGMIYVEYFKAASENAIDTIQFLINGFCKRNNDPFYGIPKILLMDKGSGNTSNFMFSWCDRLGIKLLTHEAGNPRAKGGVERMHDAFERFFEGRLNQIKIETLETLNAFARQATIAFNAGKIHSRLGTPRLNAWLKIKPSELISCDAKLMKACVESKLEDRTVNKDLSINFTVKGYTAKTYSLEGLALAGENIIVGQKVAVRINPFKYPAIDVGVIAHETGEIVFHTIEPALYDEYGQRLDGAVIGEEYKAMPKTKTDKKRDEMAKQAFAVPTTDEAKKAKKGKVKVFQEVEINGEKVKLDPLAAEKKVIEQLPTYLPKQSTSLELKNETKIAVPEGRLMRLVVERFGRALNAFELARIERDYPNGVYENDVPTIMERISKTENVQEKQA